MPYFWLDFKPGYPDLFGNRVEGYQTLMVFQGDIHRLEADGADALVNMFTRHDGALVKVEPGWRVPLADLRFKRDKIQKVAELIKAAAARVNDGQPIAEASAGAGGTVQVWTVNKPQRYAGYAAPLHRLIVAAHKRGEPRPTARDVLEAWRNAKPAEIAKVLPDGFDYYDAKGNTKVADLEAIRKAIGRMTSAL